MRTSSLRSIRPRCAHLSLSSDSQQHVRVADELLLRVLPQLLLSDPSSLGHLLFSLPSPFAFAKHLALFHHPSIDLTLAAELLDIASSPDDLDDLLAELVKDRVGQDGETLRGMAPTWAKALRRALRKRLEEGAGK